MKPESYPLPWCDEFDMPWWKINMRLIHTLPKWREWQTTKPMSEIIPVARWIIGL